MPSSVVCSPPKSPGRAAVHCLLSIVTEAAWARDLSIPCWLQLGVTWRIPSCWTPFVREIGV